jgi:hypothetical protein
VILDLDQFIRREKPFWEELERATESTKFENVASARRFYYLYERASSDLAKVQTFATELELRRYLEGLVGEAYARLHRRREDRVRFRPFRWFFLTFPDTFRRHVAAFWLSLGLSLLGAGVGALALVMDPDNKWLLVPAQFGHLMESPRDRVHEEENRAAERRGQIEQGRRSSRRN